MPVFKHVASCFLVCLAWASACGAEQRGTGLSDEMSELVSSRRKAIASVEIVAEHLSLGDGLLKAIDTESLRRALANYGASERSTADRAHLFNELCTSEGAKLYRQVTLVQDGTRYSLSKAGDNRYVTDHRAIVRSTMPGSPGSTAIIYRLEGVLRPLDIRDFSQELKSPFLKSLTPGQVVVDGEGQLLAVGKLEPTTSWKVAISREDGILAYSQTDSPKGRWITIQSGRVVTPAGIPFPAVIGEAHFKGESPDSLILLIPSTIKVNEALPDKAFTIAMPSGTKIIDERYPGHEPRSAAEDVEDIVELADSLAGQQPAS